MIIEASLVGQQARRASLLVWATALLGEPGRWATASGASQHHWVTVVVGE